MAAQPARRTATRSSRSRAAATTAGDDTEGRKLAEVVARRIERKIEAEGWPIGEVIGSEAGLLEEHQVSRAVLREAIRLLEHHGVATMKRGPGGGLTVTAPDATAAAEAVARYLNYAGVTSGDLWEARSIIEQATVRLAAERLDEAGIDKLNATLEAERAQLDNEVTSDINDLHVVIAELTRNPALRLFADILVRVTFDKTNRQLFVGDAARKHSRESHDAHEGIVEALVSGDLGRALHRMDKHLDVAPSFTR